MPDSTFKPIKITFKQGEKDIYDYISNYSSPAAHIKDLIRAEKKNQEKPAAAPQIEF